GRVLITPLSRTSFFFQAEDGIRYRTVTGVQTCALPICACANESGHRHSGSAAAVERPLPRDGHERRRRKQSLERSRRNPLARRQIGRASCRERVWRSVATASLRAHSSTQRATPERVTRE